MLVLIPILMGIIALGWTLFFWFIQVKSVQILWSIRVAVLCATVTGVVMLFVNPTEALALVVVAIVGITPVLRTYLYRDPKAALQPLPYSFVVYTVLMLCSYTLTAR